MAISKKLSGITNCERLLVQSCQVLQSMTDCYYKVCQVLQRVTSRYYKVC